MAESRFGVWLQQRGSVTNGSVSATRATIGGYEYGIEIDGPATVSNFGDIYSAGHLSFGVATHSGGTLTNGSATSHAAVISGYSLGVYLGNGDLSGAQGTLSNFGTIESLGTGDQAFGYACSGILVNTEGAIINGAANDSVALIEGYQGIYDYTTAPLTITNFGVIDGEGGVAVKFKSANDELIVEAGSSFVGQVLGAGGTLDLASGTGTLTASGGTVTVSGSMATTTFQDFDTLMVGAGATFSGRKPVTIAAGQSVIDAGTLTLKKAVRNAGTLEAAGGVLTVMGAVSGKGVAVVNGGTLDLAGAFTQDVTFAGSTGTLALGQSQAYGGKITGFSTSGGTSLDLADIAFVSPTEASFSGNAAGGTLTVTDGTHTALITLVGDNLGATFTAAADAGSGTTVTASAAHARPPPHALVSAMAGLGASTGPAAHLGEAKPAREAMLSLPRATAA